ncbi:hypothetical protein D3C80_1392790 [compost metagenome]
MQGKAATHAQWLVIAADQWRVAGQRLRRVGHPGRVVGVLYEVFTLQAWQQPRREDARLRRLRVNLPLACAPRAIQHHQAPLRLRVAAGIQQLLVNIGYYRLIQVQGPPSLVHGQRVDPRDTLQLLDRSLQCHQAVGSVDLVPLLQHP